VSDAPENLKDLRRYLMEKTGKTSANFGIRGVVGPKRNSGYHLGRRDIYGEGGLGDKDYSIQRPRDKRGLTDMSAGFDIQLGVAELKRMRAWLVAEATAGRADLMEIIGPGDDGRAYAWQKWTGWQPVGPRAKGDGHEWHIHLSYPRDTETADKVALFRRYYNDPEEPVNPEQVKTLQTLLNTLGNKLVVDGIYGPLTDAALQGAGDRVTYIQTAAKAAVDRAAVLYSAGNMLAIDGEDAVRRFRERVA
jgi:hypothetical protein